MVTIKAYENPLKKMKAVIGKNDEGYRRSKYAKADT